MTLPFTMWNPPGVLVLDLVEPQSFCSNLEHKPADVISFSIYIFRPLSPSTLKKCLYNNIIKDLVEIMLECQPTGSGSCLIKKQLVVSSLTYINFL